jgi:hypothetical protein
MPGEKIALVTGPSKSRTIAMPCQEFWIACGPVQGSLGISLYTLPESSGS